MRRNAVPALEALLSLSPSLRTQGGNGHDNSVTGGKNPAVEHGSEHDNDVLLLEGRCNDVSLATRKVRVYVCVYVCVFFCVCVCVYLCVWRVHARHGRLETLP